jgi:TP901 family phage tail tape measure protein
MAGEKRLAVQTTVQDGASAELVKLAQTVRKVADAEVKAADDMAKASGKVGAAKKAQITASQRVRQAIAAETAAGNPLREQLEGLRRSYAQVTARMRAAAAAGKEIPPGLVKQAAALKQAEAKIKSYTAEQARSNREAARARQESLSTAKAMAPGLTNSLKMAAAAYLSVHGAIALARKATQLLLTDQIKLGDDLSKLSQKSGLAVESIERIRFAAESSGVAVGAADTAMVKFNRAIGEATDSTTEQAKAFAKLGVDIRDADGNIKPLIDLLPEVADGLAAQGSQAERTSAAMDLFGRAGADLLPMLQNGSEGLRELFERSEELGGEMSGDLARSGERATQAMLEFEKAGAGVARSLGSSIVPAFATLTESATDALIALRESETAMDGLKGFAFGLAGPLGIVAQSAVKAAEALGFFGDEAKAAGDDAKKGSEGVSELNDEIERAARLSAEGLKRLDAIGKKQDEQRKARAEAAKKAAEQAKKQIQELDQLLDDLPDSGFASGLVEQFDAEQDALKAAKERADAEAEQRRDEANRARVESARARAAEEIRVEEEAAQRRQQIATQTAQFVGSQIGQAFGSMIDGSKSVDDAMKQMFANLVTYAINAAIEYAIAEATKAAATQAAAETKIASDASGAASGAINAHSNIPFVGVALGIAAAGAAVAAIMSMKKFQRGGMVEGGIPGADSVAAWLTPGEVVLPTRLVREMSSLMGMTGAAGPTPNAAAAPAGAGPSRPATQQQAASQSPVQMNVTFQTLTMPNRAEADRFVRSDLMPAIRRAQAAGF